MSFGGGASAAAGTATNEALAGLGSGVYGPATADQFSGAVTNSALGGLGQGVYGPATADQYAAAGGIVDGAGTGTTDWAKLAGALGGLGKKGGGGGGEGGGGGTMASAGQSSSSLGRGGGSNLFNEVVQAMMKRQQLYAANTNPQGAQSVERGRARGMLGI